MCMAHLQFYFFILVEINKTAKWNFNCLTALGCRKASSRTQGSSKPLISFLTLVPAAIKFRTQCGCLPRPDQVLVGSAGLQNFGLDLRLAGRRPLVSEGAPPNSRSSSSKLTFKLRRS